MATDRELQIALRAVTTSGTIGHQRTVLDAIRGLVLAGAPPATTVEPATEALRVLVNYNNIGWAQGFAERMRQTPFEVLAGDLCNACVVQVDGKPKVLVWRGLVRAIVYFEEWLHIGVPTNDLFEERGWADEKTIHRILYGALIPLVRHFRDGDPLPRPGEALSTQSKATIFIATAMAVQFLMMHEVGHLAAGHLHQMGETGEAAPAAISSSDDRAELHRQELEADRFVLDALNPSWLPMGSAYCMNLMTILGLLERHLGASGSHPLVADRMNHLIRLAGASCDPSIVQNLEITMTFYKELWSKPEDDVIAMTADFGIKMLGLLQNSYRLHQSEVPVVEPSAAQVRLATLWDEVVSVFWDAD